MATVSGMKYDEVNALIEFLNEKKDSISSIVEKLSDEIPAKIAQVYSGEAADTYHNTLVKCSTNINETLTDLITQLKAQAEAKRSEYEQQEEKLADSANVG